MTRTSNISDVARRIRDQHTIPLTAGKSIARALAARGWLLAPWADPFTERAVAVARQQGGRITPEQATAAMTILIPDGKGMDYTQYPGHAEFLENIFRRMPLRLQPTAEEIAAQWAANRDVEPRLTLGAFQAPLYESTVLTGTAGTGKSYALIGMLLRLCAEHGPNQVQLIIGAGKRSPHLAGALAELPHTIRAFTDLEANPDAYMRKLRYELGKRRKLWREDRERFNQLPWLLVVLDDFTSTREMRKDLYRLLDHGVRGYSDRASLVVTLHDLEPHSFWAGTSTRNRLHFGGYPDSLGEVPLWMQEVLRRSLGQSSGPFFADRDGARKVIHLRRPWSWQVASRMQVVDSPAYGESYAASVTAAIREATTVPDPRAATATRTPDTVEEEFGEDRVPKGSHTCDVKFPGLTVRTIHAAANYPSAKMSRLDLPALLPAAADADEVP